MTPYEAEHAKGTVRAVQTALQQQGLFSGKVDGEWGPMTKRAVLRYQRRNNLPRTGTLDVGTLQSMNITARGGAASGGMNSGDMNSGGAGSGAPAMPDTGAGTANPGASPPATPPSSGSGY
jgi:peptidoglycan hydrolase-like protein with peptidoglycan-binding domain